MSTGTGCRGAPIRYFNGVVWGIMAGLKKSTMSDEHKEALAVGRAEGRAVRAYLEALEAHRPKRGRKRTPASITARLEAIDAELEEADPLRRLQLIQERLDLTDELQAMGDGNELEGLEAEFVSVAGSYAQRKGITYTAFRELGVPAAVLRRADISRSTN